jgi:peroxiredoxin
MRLSVVTALVLFSGLVLLNSSPADASPATAKLGKKIANITFKDAAGKTFSLHDFKDKKAIVIVFLSFECPVSTSYSQPLANMAKEYGKHGVVFLGLTTNDDDTAAQVAKLAKRYDIPFPVVPDVRLVAADALGAQITPEVFVLDSKFILRYRGRIDDAYYERLKKHPEPTQHNLLQVLGEIMSVRPVREPSTVAIGCPIQRPVTNRPPQKGAVTYYKDVLPILQNNCQTCHRPGEVGPFSLMTYRQAVNWADDIKSYTQKRIMPPWKITEGPDFHNNRSMSDKDIATLAAWVDNGKAAGDPKHAPPPRKFPDGWQLGTPDLILTLSDEFTLGPTGKDLFRCFSLPTGLTEDKFVTAVEVRPSNPRIVHHVLLFVDTQGEGRKLERLEKDKKPAANDGHAKKTNLDKGPGYTVAMGVGFVPKGGLSGWAPGQLGRHLPQGTGYSLPKNSDVVMQVHFHRNGRLEKERTQVGLYFAKKPVERLYAGSVLAGSGGGIGPLRLFFSIPAGNNHYRLTGDLWATGDFTLYSIMPHMHLLGKEIKVAMTPPGGKDQTLIAIRDWDYNWQETYFFKEPIPVKKGTHFQVEAFYDNSRQNPNNPFNPPRRITFGEQTTNEMCFVFLGGTSASGGRRLPMTANAPKK